MIESQLIFKFNQFLSRKSFLITGCTSENVKKFEITCSRSIFAEFSPFQVDFVPIFRFEPQNMSYYANDGGHGSYNPRLHSKVAEREGFHLGSVNDDPRTL